MSNEESKVENVVQLRSNSIFFFLHQKGETTIRETYNFITRATI